MLTDPAEIIATGAAIAGLRYRNVPLRRPSYAKPTFWSLALGKTKIRPVAANLDYVPYLDIPSKVQYIGIVNAFALATEETTATPLLWRWRLDDGEIGTMSINAEVCKRGVYPVQMRKTFLAIPEGSTLHIEVRIPSAGSLTAIAGFSGWYYPDRLATEFGTQGTGQDV
jgi:hypothetical protein